MSQEAGRTASRGYRAAEAHVTPQAARGSTAHLPAKSKINTSPWELKPSRLCHIYTCWVLPPRAQQRPRTLTRQQHLPSNTCSPETHQASQQSVYGNSHWYENRGVPSHIPMEVAPRCCTATAENTSYKKPSGGSQISWSAPSSYLYTISICIFNDHHLKHSNEHELMLQTKQSYFATNTLCSADSHHNSLGTMISIEAVFVQQEVWRHLPYGRGSSGLSNSKKPC